MKKIITALTVTAMALSAAFADVSLEFTQHAIVFGDKGDLDFNGYSGKFDGDGTADGNWKFQFKNANAGVWLTVKPTLQDAKGNSVKASEYAGWTKFFDGAMTLQAGQWEARTANRFTGLAGKIQGTQYERYKMGTTGIKVPDPKEPNDPSKTIDSPATDSNRLTDKKLAAQVTYKMDGGAWVTAVLKDTVVKKDDTIVETYDSNSGIGQKSGFAVEFGTPLGEGSKLIVDFKNFLKNQYVVAGFFENSTLKDGLNFVAGFTFGRRAADVNNIEWGIDFRGTYELADNLLLTTMNNLTYNGYVSDPSLHLWDMVSLSTAVSEQLTAIFTVHWEHKNLWKDSDAAAAEADFATFDIAPMVKYQVGKGVDLTGGLSLRTSNWANRKPTTMKFEIPLMLHVSM